MNGAVPPVVFIVTDPEHDPLQPELLIEVDELKLFGSIRFIELTVVHPIASVIVTL